MDEHHPSLDEATELITRWQTVAGAELEGDPGASFRPRVAPGEPPPPQTCTDFEAEDVIGRGGFLLRTRMPQISGTSSLLRCSPGPVCPP